MKKVLSIVLSVALVVCMVPTMVFAAPANTAAEAAYSDTEGEACEGAVNVLSALGVVDGYEDGTYRPGEIVTRAEMAKLIITALGVETYATATTSQFNDMGGATWAIPVVEYAANLNIVQGYGDGRFGPSDPVTYEESVTMILRAIGYNEDLNEMNGEWPAIFVQKGRALGIFDDVEGNVLGTGATRGDIAVMLYNALELAQVYGDADGETLYKSGSEVINVGGGTTVLGINMFSTLNKDGYSTYAILDAEDADDALVEVRSYVGALGKIYYNDDDDVLAIGDVKSVFLTGTVNSDGDTFTTSDGTAYRVSNNALSGFDGNGNATSATNVPKFINGNHNAVGDVVSYTVANPGALDEVELNKPITVAAKVSGKTITNIFSVSEWSKSLYESNTKLMEDHDLTTLENKQKIGNAEFKTDYDGEIDYTTFILEGADSLDDIAVDNVVYTYTDADKTVRKVQVGTEIVEGTFEAFTPGTAGTTGNVGTQATFEIGGEAYSGTKATGTLTDERDWTLSDNDDDVAPGDEVKAYLDVTGKIYQIMQLEAGSSSYAMVLDYDIKWNGADPTDNTGTVAASSGLGSDSSLIKVMTAEGDVITLTIKSEAEVVNDDNDVVSSLSVGDIITYSLNASDQIKKITIKAEAGISASATTADVTSSGHFNGMSINDSAVIFTVATTANALKGSRTPAADSDTPAKYIRDDDASVTTLDALKGKEDVVKYADIEKSGKYSALVIDSSASSTDVIYGIVTSVTDINNDAVSARINVLVNGEEQTYEVDESISAPTKDVFYAFKLNSKGYISTMDRDSDDNDGVYEVVGDDKATYIGKVLAVTNGIKVSSGVVDPDNEKISMSSEVQYYKWNGNDNKFVVGEYGDLTGAADGNYAVFLDTDANSKKDKVADVVIIGPASALSTAVPGANIS